MTQVEGPPPSKRPLSSKLTLAKRVGYRRVSAQFRQDQLENWAKVEWNRLNFGRVGTLETLF
jgi:hypothetical protein